MSKKKKVKKVEKISAKIKNDAKAEMAPNQVERAKSDPRQRTVPPERTPDDLRIIDVGETIPPAIAPQIWAAKQFLNKFVQLLDPDCWPVWTTLEGKKRRLARSLVNSGQDTVWVIQAKACYLGDDINPVNWKVIRETSVYEAAAIVEKFYWDNFEQDQDVYVVPFWPHAEGRKTGFSIKKYDYKGDRFYLSATGTWEYGVERQTFDSKQDALIALLEITVPPIPEESKPEEVPEVQIKVSKEQFELDISKQKDSEKAFSEIDVVTDFLNEFKLIVPQANWPEWLMGTQEYRLDYDGTCWGVVKQSFIGRPAGYCWGELEEISDYAVACLVETYCRDKFGQEQNIFIAPHCKILGKPNFVIERCGFPIKQYLNEATGGWIQENPIIFYPTTRSALIALLKTMYPVSSEKPQEEDQAVTASKESMEEPECRAKFDELQRKFTELQDERDQLELKLNQLEKIIRAK